VGELEKCIKKCSGRRSGLRSLGLTFPPHDSSDAGSNPAEVVEFLVDLLHVKEPQARGPLSKIIGHFPSRTNHPTPPADGGAW
jgi:hypothetical protein